MKCFSHRQLWRTWLLKGNFPLNEANQGEDDGAEPIVYPILAPWLVEMSVAGKSSTLQGLRTIISKLIASSFCEDLRVCTIVAVVGQCWHGVREDIFNFLRTHPGLTPRNAAVIDEIIDFVDKGACTGLQTVLVTYTSSDEYALQAAQDCETALDDVINVITAGLRSAGIDLTSANLETLSAAKVAVEKSWESIRSSSFFQMCGAFESVFKGYIEQAVCADIGSKLSMTIEPKGFETEMANMLPLLVTHEVKERISLVSQGYWEVMSDLSLLIAADVLRELSRVVETTSLDTGGFGSPSAKLMTIAIELVREVLMSSTGTSPGWKLTLGKAGFWCVQAEKSRDAREVYRNLDRWDEYRFFSGSGGNWPINDVF
jgi:hypothetical protein